MIGLYAGATGDVAPGFEYGALLSSGEVAGISGIGAESVSLPCRGGWIVNLLNGIERARRSVAWTVRSLLE